MLFTVLKMPMMSMKNGTPCIALLKMTTTLFNLTVLLDSMKILLTVFQISFLVLLLFAEYDWNLLNIYIALTRKARPWIMINVTLETWWRCSNDDAKQPCTAASAFIHTAGPYTHLQHFQNDFAQAYSVFTTRLSRY